MSKSLKKLIDINGLREFKNKLVGTDSPYVQTGAVDQTVAGTKTFSKPIVGSVTGSSGSCTGNAATANIATKATQDAAGNTITTTYATKAENNTKANNSEVVHKSGDETIAGTKTFSNGVLLTNTNALMAQHGGYTLVLRNDGSSTYLLISDKDGVPGTWSSARPFVISNSTGVCSINGNASTATKLATARTIALSGAATGTATGFDGSGNIAIPVTSLDASKLTGTASVSTTGNAATATTATTAKACTGNAATATKLQTARTINGTSFNGTANITTANWGTARNISITDGTNTSTAVSVNGSANVSLNLPATIKANLTGNCSGSSGSCTGNAATANIATKATQDAAGNTITTTYATKSEIIVHAGVIIPFAGTSVPTGYLLCNGAAVSRTNYANLFAAIGTLYGAGDGSTTFNLPDARDRVLQGASGGHSVGSYIAAGLPNITGDVGNGGGFYCYQGCTGAFSLAGGAGPAKADPGVILYSNFDFNAHKSNALYGASNTVQSPAIATNFIIKY